MRIMVTGELKLGGELNELRCTEAGETKILASSPVMNGDKRQAGDLPLFASSPLSNNWQTGKLSFMLHFRPE